MNRKITVIIMMLILLPLCHVSPLTAEELKKITLTEELSIGDLDDDLIYMWTAVYVDETGNIYLTDLMDYSLKKFDPMGQFVKKTGRKGQGPGEFQAPLGLTGSDSYLYVIDQYQVGVQVFDKDLKFVNRIPFKQVISEFEALSDDCLAVVPLSLNAPGNLFFIDLTGNTLRKIQYWEEEKPRLLQAQVGLDIDTEGNIYLAYLFQDKIDKMDPQGKILWSQSLLNVKKVKRKTIKSFNVPTEIVYKSIVVDRFGHLMVLGGEFSKNNGQDVYVLNSQGEHLITFTLPDTSHCLYLDSQNNLYSRANSGVTLKKFKLNYIFE